MVALNRIYTRTGDDGTTGLASGARRAKSDLRVETFGTVDETNACVGLARLQAPPELDAALARVQNDLFDLGADLATPQDSATPEGGERAGRAALRVSAAQVARLEAEIDAFNARLAPLRSFVLPGGSATAAALHLARTVCRRAERQAVALAALPAEAVSASALQYLNRLSDFLFVAARIANDDGRADVLWVPGANR